MNSKLLERYSHLHSPLCSQHSLHSPLPVNLLLGGDEGRLKWRGCSVVWMAWDMLAGMVLQLHQSLISQGLFWEGHCNGLLTAFIVAFGCLFLLQHCRSCSSVEWCFLLWSIHTTCKMSDDVRRHLHAKVSSDVRRRQTTSDDVQNRNSQSISMHVSMYVFTLYTWAWLHA